MKKRDRPYIPIKVIKKFLLAIAILLIQFLFWSFLGRPQVIQEPNIPTDQKLQCVSYSPPYQKHNPLVQLISPFLIDQDIKLISEHFECLRTYSVASIEPILKSAQKYHVKVMLGIWVSSSPKATRKEIRETLSMIPKYHDRIQSIVVGNEALLRREVTGADLSQYIREVKAGSLGIPVTYADVWEFWQKNPEVAPVVDFITIHILPYWEDIPITIDQAIYHVRDIRERIVKEFSGKEIFIGETGWPSTGRAREGALPSRVNEARFVRGIVELFQKRGWKYNLIEAFDQPWKRSGEGAVGGYWGIWSSDRRDKGLLSGSVSNYPEWRRLFYISSSISGIIFLLAICLRGFDSYKNVFFASMLSLVTSLAVTLHGYQVFYEARTQSEWNEGLILILFSLITAGLLFVKNLKSDFVRLIIFLFLFSNTLEIWWQGRYLSFTTWGWLIPSFYLVVSSWRLPVSALERSLGLLLFVSGMALFSQETIKNEQALAWIFLVLVSSIFLIRPWAYFNAAHEIEKVLVHSLTLLGWVGLGLLMGWIVRYGFMEPKDIHMMCLKERPWWCEFRDFIGLNIHFRNFAWIGWVLTIGGLFHGGSRLKAWGLVISAFSIVLYSVDVGGMAFVVAWISGFTSFTLQRTKTGSFLPVFCKGVEC